MKRALQSVLGGQKMSPADNAPKPQPLSEQQLQELEIKKQYLTNINISAVTVTRQLKVNMMLSMAAGELLPETRNQVAKELMDVIALMREGNA